MLNEDYALQGNADSFMIRHYDGAIPNDLARLRGVRFLTAVESGETKRLNESVVKSLTGGDQIIARFLHKEFF